MQKKVCRDVELKTLFGYHDLHVQSKTFFLADIFKIFQNRCIKTYQIYPAHLLPAPGLIWQTCLKKTEVKLELSTDVDMLLIVEKGIRGGTCHAIYQYATSSNKYMKDYNQNKESSYLMINLYRCTMSNVAKIT